MPNEKRNEYLTRNSILQLLSDDEIARVSTAETETRLDDGEEYIDLEELEQGVRRAAGPTTPMGRILPRKAVQEATWGKIVKHLASPEAMPIRASKR